MSEENWDVPLIDYCLMEMPEGMIPCRQANAVAVTTINCRDDESRQVLTITLYSTVEGEERGMILPMSPETIKELAEALAKQGEEQ